MAQNFSDIPVRINDTDVDAGWWNILRLAGISVDDSLAGYEENAQTGSNITLTLPAKGLVILTGAITSIAKVAVPTASTQNFIIVNRSGSDLTIKNTDAAAGDIVTGIAADVTFKNGAAMSLAYDPKTSGRWRIVGGTGSGGGGFNNIVTRTATGTVGAAEDCTLIDATSGNIVLTLPAVTIKEQHNFKRIDSVETNTVTIQRAGADTIDGQSTYTIPFQYGILKLVGTAAGTWGIF